MAKGRQLISSSEAVKAKGQHKKPCSDCPWARTAVPGWLGGKGIVYWTRLVHSDAKIDCHTLIGAQCAGSSIYRANVCKVSKDSTVLKLPTDNKLVFEWDEFEKHHSAIKFNRKSDWIICNNCGNQTHIDLKDCTCEECGHLDWREENEKER